jgi:hypothetical protein
MSKVFYPAIISEDRYVNNNMRLKVVFPDFPRLTVYSTWEKLYVEIKQELQLSIDEMVADKEKIPESRVTEFMCVGDDSDYGYGFTLECAGVWSRDRVDKPIAIILVEVEIP